MDRDELTFPGAEFFLTGAVEAAQSLLGCYLLSETPNPAGGPPIITGGRIVETEAYTATDPASHSYNGETVRKGSMFREGGTLYVYLIYGVHYCLNVVVGPEGIGEAVLLRALEPIWGVREMARRRGIGEHRSAGGGASPTASRRSGTPRGLRGIADGPGKVARALGVTAGEDGISLLAGPVRLLLPRESLPSERIIATHRVGISKAARKHWRFVDRDSSLLSRRLRR